MQVVVEGLDELRQALARMNPELDKALQEEIGASARLGADAVQGNAPVRSGLLKSSVRAFTDGPTAGGVEVTATRRGYPYPQKVNRQRGFFDRALTEVAPKVQKRMEKVLDAIARAFAGG